MRRFAALIVVGVAAFLSQPLSAQVETIPASEIWALPPVDCGEHYLNCEIRLSLEGDLYIYSYTDATLFVSKRYAENYTQYNLQPYVRWITGGSTEFIPFSTANMVIFIGSPYHLSRLELETGSFVTLPQNTEYNFVACNLKTGKTFIPRMASRIGTGHQLLVCSRTDNNEIEFHIVDVDTEATLQTISFGAPLLGDNSLHPPWQRLIGGKDGSVYFDVSSANPQVIWHELTGEMLPEMAEWGWRLFQYNPASEAWTVRNIEPEQMASANYPPKYITNASHLYAVTPNGDVIHWLDYLAPFNSDDWIRAWELSRFNAEFELVERIESTDFNELFWFGGVSADGMVLLLSESGLRHAQVVWFGQDE